MKYYLFVAVFAAFAIAAPLSANSAPRQWTCYAQDYVDGHSKFDPETEDCIQSYHKGEGICLSHAKSAAIERCLSYSKNKATCKVDQYANCFRPGSKATRSDID